MFRTIRRLRLKGRGKQLTVARRCFLFTFDFLTGDFFLVGTGVSAVFLEPHCLRLDRRHVFKRTCLRWCNGVSIIGPVSCDRRHVGRPALLLKTHISRACAIACLRFCVSASYALALPPEKHHLQPVPPVFCCRCDRWAYGLDGVSWPTTGA